MKKAVIYARVSSKEQEREGFSIPAQLKLLRESLVITQNRPLMVT
jgi:DNA invertase Pin-like site-specific DNA recombinase